MRVAVNLRHLEERPAHLHGEASLEDLEVADIKDELVEMTEPLHYDVHVEKQNQNLHVFGQIWQRLTCHCKRCLKEFPFDLKIDPYHTYVPLEGEDAAPVANDLVDLSPFFREDMLLAFPQHPLCSEDCKGIANLSASATNADKNPSDTRKSSAWSALDKLKF